MNALRRHRYAAGWSQATLARRVGVGRQTVSAWERGRRTPDLAAAGRVARALGVRVEALLDDPPRASSPRFDGFPLPGPTAETCRTLATVLVASARVERAVGGAVIVPPVVQLAGAARTPRYQRDRVAPEAIERAARVLRAFLAGAGEPQGDLARRMAAVGVRVRYGGGASPVRSASAFGAVDGLVLEVPVLPRAKRREFLLLREFVQALLRPPEDAAATRVDGGRAGHAPRLPRGWTLADRIARAILLDVERLAPALAPWLPTGVPEPVLHDAAEVFGVPPRELLRRACDVGWVSRRRVHAWIDARDARYGRERDPNVVEPYRRVRAAPRTASLAAVLGAVARGAIDRTTAAAYLDLDAPAVDDLLDRATRTVVPAPTATSDAPARRRPGRG